MSKEYTDFKIHVHKGYVQNNFLIEYKDKILLTDGACRTDVDKISDFIKVELNRDIQDLKLIVVTHSHPDHAGAAYLLRKKFNIPIAAFHNIDLWYSGIGGATQQISDILQMQFMATQVNKKFSFKSQKYKRILKPDFLLTDQSTIPFFDDWQVIHGPGHTAHNILLYNKKNSLIYVADTIINIKGRFFPPVPVLFPSAMKETLLKIKGFNPATILCAHSDPPILEYKDEMVDKVIKKVDTENTPFIKFFYNLSKFTPEYRKNKEKRID
jgi:glyoxylase-like metal-dependent hydrolase (beta-lactamase superfamily II)